MSTSKLPLATPVPVAVWLTVQFADRRDRIARRRFAERLSSLLAGTGIRPVVSTRLIGLHRPSGFSPFEVSLITTWLTAQPEVLSQDFMPPVATILRKDAQHG